MSKPERGPQGSTGYHLWHASLLWTRAVSEALEPLGLTHTQFFVLGSTRWLGLQAGPPMQREVADHVGIDRNMTSQVVRALEERGLLAREPSPEDTRAWRLRLTPAGERAFQPAVAALRKVDAAFFGVLERRHEGFVEALKQLRAGSRGDD